MEKIQSEKGFTMIELIIVITIMGILSAVLVPSFTSLTRKTKLRADISTIQQVQRQIDLYMIENDGNFPGSTLANKEAPREIEQLSGMAVKDLLDNQYLNKNDTTGDTSIKLQSKNVEVHYNPGKEHLILHIAGEKEKKIQSSLGSNDREWTEVKEN